MTEQAAEQPKPEQPPCGHEGCDKPSLVHGAPYGARCQEHVPKAEASYRVQTLEVIAITCGECGLGLRVEHPRAIGLAKFKKPVDGVLCRGCGHMLTATPESAIITAPGPVARMGTVLGRVGRKR